MIWLRPSLLRRDRSDEFLPSDLVVGLPLHIHRLYSAYCPTDQETTMQCSTGSYKPCTRPSSRSRRLLVKTPSTPVIIHRPLGATMPFACSCRVEMSVHSHAWKRRLQAGKQEACSRIFPPCDRIVTAVRTVDVAPAPRASVTRLLWVRQPISGTHIHSCPHTCLLPGPLGSGLEVFQLARQAWPHGLPRRSALRFSLWLPYTPGRQSAGTVGSTILFRYPTIRIIGAAEL